MSEVTVKKEAHFGQLVNKLFGEKLARARRVRNISQSELADRAAVSRATIANLEGGRQNVQLHQVFALAKSLNVEPDSLIPTMPELPSSSTSSDQLFLEITKARLNAVMGGQ
jgi:transcriptional regulator with XRE-family HTH domain